MSVIRHETLQFTESPGGNATSPIATARRGADEVSVIRQRQEPGGTNPAHWHDREEVLTVLAGTLDVTVGNRVERVMAGDTVIIPAGTPHKIENPGGGVAEWLIIATAGVRFFGANREEMFPAWAQ